MCRLGRAAFLGAFLFTIAACGGKGDDDGKSGGAKILSFTSTQETIVEGESVTLQWETKGASHLVLTADGLRIDQGELAASGSMEVRPERSTTYGLEAVPARGASVREELFVEVLPFGAPKVDAFTASPSETKIGDSVTLSWQVRGASRIELSEKGGQSLTSTSEAEGSFTVQPRKTTTYVLQATNRHGVTTEEATVQIARRPTLAFRITPGEATFGQEVTLSWEVQHASTLVITDPSGEIIYEGPGEDGSMTLVAQRTGLYRAVASGVGGEEIKTAPLAIEPVVERFEALVAGAVRPGSLAQVEWAVLGAERVVISNGSQDLLTTTQTTGSEMLPVGPMGSFLLRAYSGSMVTTAQTTAETTEKPVIVRLSTGALVTAGHGVIGESTVGWEVEGAAKLYLEIEPGGRIELSEKNPRIDEIVVPFSGPGTVTLIAVNDAGETRMTVPSPVDPVPTIAELFAAPSRAGSGEGVEIHWTAIDADTVLLLQDGEERTIDPKAVQGSFRTDILSAPSSFELLAYNTLGYEVRSSVTVEVGAPNVLSFDTHDGMHFYRIGSTVHLVWRNDGGTWLRVSNRETEEILCSTNDWLQVREGGCSIQLPEEQGEVPLLLEVGNASGTDRQPLDIRAVMGPIILEFLVERDEMTEGETLLFSWVTLPDADGNLPELALVDDRGISYPMDDVEVLEGSKRFRIEGWGNRTFTLTASTENPPPYSLTTEVMVYGIPIVDLLASNPPFAESEGDRVEISWATEHGTSLELYLLSPEGVPADTPFFTTQDESRVQAGSAQAEPTIAQPNVRLVVRNKVGYPTEADLHIGVDPATVASFTANGIEAPGVIDLLEGENLTLAWETLRSTDALLLEEYIDLSTRPNAVNLGQLGTSATNKTWLFFPEGFAFPYDGAVYDALQIMNAGYISFDLEVAASGANQRMPYTAGSLASYRGVDIAPFWDSIRADTVWWEYIEGPVDRLVIQWKDAEFTTSTYNPANLNFQVVLFEDGRFELRYGEMSGAHANARAASATIGAQSRDCSNGCTFGEELVYNVEQVNGLEGRVYRFNGLQGFQEGASTPVPMPEDGSITFQPTDSRTYTLRTWNGHSQDERELRVNVHPYGKLQAWTVPEFPEPGQDVTLHWEGSTLTSLVIEDGSGAVIHTADPSELDSGFIELGTLAQGDYVFTVRAVGAVPRDQIVETIQLHVYDAFSIEAFTASADRIKLGESVQLSWAATNAHSVQIEAIPGGILGGTSNPAGGTITHSPEETTTYVLTVESHGRIQTAELTVDVRRVWFEEAQFSRTEVQLGDTLEISWDFTDPTGEAVFTIEPEWKQYFMLEASDEAPFESIVNNGGTLVTRVGADTTGYGDVEFPTGFVFPYFGKEVTFLRAFHYGYVNFGTGQTSGSSSKSAMPRVNTTYPDGVIGVFWGANSTQTTGKIYQKYVQVPGNSAKDHLIVEWANFQFSASTYNPSDLNFQLVLFRDGTFDFRYGTMAGTDAARANGSIHGAGFNSGDWGSKPYAYGYTLFYNYAMPGGLSNRTWRYTPFTPESAGSWTYLPQSSGPIRICVEVSGWKECQEEFVTVFEPGDIAITELMVDPGTGAPQWFEVRNLAAGPFDLEGKTIRIGEDTHTIQKGSAFIVPPGGYAVFAQADHPDLHPDYVYGTGLTMTTPSGKVAIEWDGIVMGETSWNAGWLFQTGIAKELHAVHHKPRTPVRNVSTEYCDSSVVFGTGLMGTPGGHAGDCATSFGYVVDFVANHPFIDIRDTGMKLPAFRSGSQSYVVPGGLGFAMPFFGDVATDLWLNNHGLIGLSGTASTSYSNRALGNSGTGTTLRGQGLIAPFWEQLAVSRDDSMVYIDRRVIGGSQVVIVQFDGYKYYSTTYPGDLTFQAQIWENGDIAFVYGDLKRIVHLQDTIRYQEGRGATIGIEAMGNAADTEAVQYSYDTPILRSFQSFLFQKL